MTESLARIRENNRGILFVVLNLKDQGGRIVSHNVYWLSSDGTYKELNNLSETSVAVSIQNATNDKTGNKYSVRIVNNSSGIAFFLRPRLTVDGEEILPSYWSAGYITLAPSESTTLTVSCPADKISGKLPVLKLSGWNVPEQTARIVK